MIITRIVVWGGSCVPPYKDGMRLKVQIFSRMEDIRINGKGIGVLPTKKQDMNYLIGHQMSD